MKKQSAICAGFIVVALTGFMRSAEADLVALYRFDNSTADDSGPNGLNGTLHGNAAIVSDADANRGMVLSLDSMEAQLNTSFVSISDPTGLLNFGGTGPHQGSATLAAWVYSDDWQVHSSVFNQGEWRNGIGVSVKADAPAGGCTECQLWLGAEPFNVDGTSISVPANEAHRSDLGVGQGAWNHIAATWNYDGTQTAITFYINGVATGYAEGGGVMNGRVTPPIDNDSDGVGNSRIGAEWRDTNEANVRWGYGGRIDDVAIFSTALEAEQILAVMEGSFDLAPVNLGLTVNSVTGQVSITNPTENAITFSSYRLTSEAGALDVAGWDPVSTGTPIAGFPQGNGTGNGWEVGPNPSSSELVEWNLTGESMLSPGQSISLGTAYNENLGAEDLRFQYTLADGALRSGTVEYITGPGGEPGDYNNNGVVDAADYTVWRDNLGSAASLPNDDSPGVQQDDYTRWKTNFGNGAGSGAALGAGTVPEPSTLGLLALSMMAAGAAWRRVS